jgi:pantothenate kinase type III
MILCLDIGNSQIFGGVFDGDKLLTQFRRTSQAKASSDEFGVFFRVVLPKPNGPSGLVTLYLLPLTFFFVWY